jgi:hypothetical protein
MTVKKLTQPENIVKMDYKNFVPHGLQSALQSALANPSLRLVSLVSLIIIMKHNAYSSVPQLTDDRQSTQDVYITKIKMMKKLLRELPVHCIK